MMHGVCTVPNDYPLDALTHLFADGDRQFFILLGPHVLREDSKEFFCFQIADLRQFRHCSVEFARRKSRDHCSGAVIQTRGDGAAGAQQFNLGQTRGKGKLFFRDLIMRFLVSGFTHLQNCIHINAHIVTGRQFQHYVTVVVVFTAGQDNALECAAGGLNCIVTPDPGLEVFQHLQRATFVAFKKIQHLFYIYPQIT